MIQNWMTISGIAFETITYNDLVNHKKYENDLEELEERCTLLNSATSSFQIKKNKMKSQKIT